MPPKCEKHNVFTYTGRPCKECKRDSLRAQIATSRGVIEAEAAHIRALEAELSL